MTQARKTLLETLKEAQSNLTGWYNDPNGPEGHYCNCCTTFDDHTPECIYYDLEYFIDLYEKAEEETP